MLADTYDTPSDWYALFFEACKEKSPTGAGVDIFGLSYTISLIALVAGIVVKMTGKYLVPIYVGWILIVIGAGLLTTLRADSSLAKAIGFELVIGSGVGVIYVAVIFPVLASIPVTQAAPAMALFVFSRNFGYVSLLPADFPSLSHIVANDLLNLDLGCHHRGCRDSE